MTASNGTLLFISAENGLTNEGDITVHGNNFSIRAHAQLESDTHTTSSHVVTGGNIDFNSGSILVDTWGAFTAYAAANFTQAAASSITARDNVTTVDLTSVGNFSNAGTINATTGAKLTLNVGGNLLNSGTIGAASNATLNGTIQNNFRNTVTGDIEFGLGTLTANNTGGTFVNNGTIDANGGSLTAVNPTSATNSGILTAQNGGSVTVHNSTVLTNSGTLRAGSASTLTFNGGETQVGASSKTQVDSGGTLTVGGTGLTLGTGLVAGDGGVLTGGGTVVGDVHNLSGLVSPGDPQSLTIIGDYDQGALGALDLLIEGDIPGVTYDTLNVTGDVTLDGALTLNFDTAFQPFMGETFDFLHYGGTLSGSFSSIQVLGLNNNLTYAVSFQGGNGTLLISPTAVPEPGIVAMLAGLSVVGAGFLRGKRK